MPRVAKRLSARAVSTISKPGLHADGDGLYLVVDKAGAKRWSYIFQWTGKRAEMGLGRVADVTLAEARDAAFAARQKVRNGINPIEARKAASREAEDGVTETFGAFADELVDKLESEFRNDKHVAQWRMTLGDSYCAALRPKRLNEVDTAAVLEVLEPIWTKRPETASRLRGRIERVLDAAKAAGLREGENPARWRGHLKSILPKRQKLTRGHHKALPYQDVPGFMERLRASGGLSALALEWTILAAARTGETLGARWEEVDKEAAVWTVPAERMKAGREHRVPLTPRMLELVDVLEKLRGESAYLFPGARKGRPLSGMSMTMQLRRMKVDVTVHGFRSAFRDWVSETTTFPDSLAEAALAHVVGDATERAYRRGDALERRRELMTAWEAYCDSGVDPDDA